MIRATILALFIGLCHSSRLLLQTPAQAQGPPPAQPNPYYNPYYVLYNQLYFSIHGSYPPPITGAVPYDPPAQQPPANANPNPSPAAPAPATGTGTAPAPVDPVVVPAPAPATGTGTAPAPAPVDPVVPAQPAANPAGQTPVNPPQPAVNPPGQAPNPNTVPVQPVNQGQPPLTGPGIIPGLPPLPPPPTPEMTCGMAPPYTMCANRFPGSLLGPLHISNIARNFKLYCDTPAVCARSQIDIDVPMGVRQINQLLFSEAQAGALSTINIRNDPRNGNNVELSNLECNGVASCYGLTINGWGVSLNDVNCPYPGNCANCFFNSYTTIPSLACPQPYDPSSIGNPACIIETNPCFGY